jgi:galactitol-specific phosphotransferase system IIC component
MSTTSVVLAVSENQQAWQYTLIAAVVVLLVVIALLEGLRRAVKRLEVDLWQTWVNGKAVVKNTATGYSLKNTRDSAEELVRELSHHG